MQEILIGIIGLAAVFFLYKSIRKSMTDHNCDDCSIAEAKKRS